MTVRAWAAVHGTRPALGVMAVVAPASLFFARTTVEHIGMVRLLTPVSALLLLPALAGLGSAIACANTARVPLPDPPRAVAARAAWAAAWALLAVLVANLGQLIGAGPEWAAVSRNILIYMGIGLVMVRIGQPQLAWLPVLAYTIACMLFGYPPYETRYYWWAAVMEPEVTAAQAVTVAVLFVTALAAYLLFPPNRWRGIAGTA